MPRPESQATTIAKLALDLDGLELFCSQGAEEPYALIPTGTHREVWPLGTMAANRWLGRLYYEHTGGAAHAPSILDARRILEAKALFEGERHEVFLRVAKHEGAVYLDLADEQWRAIEITANGWQIVTEPPVMFRRPRGMLALPEPASSGEGFGPLRSLVNLEDEEWPLLLGWETGALRPRGPYAVLVVVGEAGSGKSTLLRLARELVDPNEAPVRGQPRKPEDLLIAARNGLIVALDNISHLTIEESDDLARLATGTGLGKRQLFSDLEETLIYVARPVAVNGIDDFATRGDLLDRAIVINPSRIESYRPEAIFWQEFREAHPLILGALLDAVVIALANEETTEAPNVRMADFARWIVAAEPGLGLEEGEFLEAYNTARETTVETVLDDSPLVAPLRQLASYGFEGTASELLERLAGLVYEAVTRRDDWPKAPHILSGRLRRLAPALRAERINIEMIRNERKRTIRLASEAPPPPPVVGSPEWIAQVAADVRNGKLSTEEGEALLEEHAR